MIPCLIVFQPVVSFILDGLSESVRGVALEDGSEIQADIVLSNATPKVTFLDLLPKVFFTYTMCNTEEYLKSTFTFGVKYSSNYKLACIVHISDSL